MRADRHGQDAPLITERLTLRRARLEDLPAMHAILSDPRAMTYWSTPPHADLDQTRAWLQSMIEAEPDQSDDYIIEWRGQVIGKAGCFRLPEVGYVLHPQAWGLGLAREALAAIIPMIFARHQPPALIADVDPRNAASLKLLSRLGFTETGRAERTWLVGDTWCDSVYLRLPRPEPDG